MVKSFKQPSRAYLTGLRKLGRTAALKKLSARTKWSPLNFRDAVGKVFWNLRARNGRILCDGGEAYSNEAKARQGFRAAAKLAAKALAEMEGRNG